jgi:hypothetical protein
MGLPKIVVPEYSLTLPSNGKEVKYRPFLVKEEKILLIAMESEDEQQIVDATKTVIKNCVFGDFEVEEMPIFDVEYVFLWLRSKSKGEIIELKYDCPKCENKIPLSFNTEEIKITNDDTHNNKIELTENLGVVLRYPNMTLQAKLESMDTNEVEKIFTTVVECIDYIYDNENTYPNKDHTRKEMSEFVDSLTDSQFQKLTHFFETMPKLRHEVVLRCKNKNKQGKKKDKKTVECGYTEDLVLEGLQSFFV